MKRKVSVILLILFLLITVSNAQTVHINGYIEDEHTGERLIGANIVNIDNSAGSVSNKYGYYNLSVSKNVPCHITFTYIGYKPYSIMLTCKNDTTINIKLTANLEIEEVVINAGKTEKIEDQYDMSKSSIPIKDLRLLPSTIGEPDVLRAYQLIPGIQGGQEGTNGLYVRGGTPDQNLFLLDDVPLYNVSHLGGFVSVFDVSMLKSIDLYKGGFPARYNGRLSSIVDIRMKDGNMKDFSGEFGIGIVLTKLMIETPLKKDTSSLAFSFRRCNFDLLSYAKSFLIPDPQYPDDRYGYTFHDLNFKWNYKISAKNRVYLSAYLGNDFIRFKSVQESTFDDIENITKGRIKWGNIMLSTRWNHIYNYRLFHNFTLATTRYKYKNLYKSETNSKTEEDINYWDEYVFSSGISDIIAKLDFEYHQGKFLFRFGTSGIVHQYKPATASYTQGYFEPETGDTVINSPVQSTTLNALEGNSYLELETEITRKLKTNTGINLGIYTSNGKNYLTPQPRFLFNYLIVPSISLKGSYCQMVQYAHLLTNSGAGLPTDLWIPSTASIKPEKSKQFALGIAHTDKYNIEYSIEVFYKNMTSLIEYKAGTIIFDNADNFTEKIELDGIGITKGIELLIQKTTGKISGWIGYTLSKSDRTFKGLNNGNSFPFKYDRRHCFSIVSNWKINQRVNLSATWVYNTGHALTLPVSKYKINFPGGSDSDNPTYPDFQPNVHIYNGKNSYRMPPYHRLDIGLNFTKPVKKGLRTVSVGVYNVYNNQNAYFVYFKQAPMKVTEDEDGTPHFSRSDKLELYQMTLMPVFPYFSYSLKF